MTLDQIILNRRSIRKYQSRPVPRETLNQVLEAGRLAPSAKNQQDWHFTVVENAALRAQLADACCGQQMVAQAPVTLVLWSQAEHVMTCGQSMASVDCSIALSFILLKAAELGLGACWLGAFYADRVREVLQLPQDAAVVAVTPLGWPDEQPAARARKPLEEICDYRA